MNPLFSWHWIDRKSWRFLSKPELNSHSSVEVHPAEPDHDFWCEQDRGSTSGFDLDNGSFEVLQPDDKQQSTSAGYNYFPPSRASSSSSSTRVQQKFSRENRGPVTEDHLDTFQYQGNQVSESYFDDRTASSRSVSASHASSIRSKTSSESSWEGSSAKVSKSAREKRGRKTMSSAVPSTAPSTAYGKGKSLSEQSSTHADDDTRDCNPLSTVGNEMVERNAGPQSVASLHVPSHHIPGFEPTQTSGSDSMIPLAPVLLGPGLRQRAVDNSRVLPFAFYPTGPPVPFVTMLPVYNFPSETGNSDASICHFSGEGEG